MCGATFQFSSTTRTMLYQIKNKHPATSESNVSSAGEQVS